MSTSKYRVESCCGTLPVERARYRLKGFARQFSAAGYPRMLVKRTRFQVLFYTYLTMSRVWVQTAASCMQRPFTCC